MGLKGTVLCNQEQSIMFSDLNSLTYHQPPPVYLVICVFTLGLVTWMDSRITIKLKIARHLIEAKFQVSGCLLSVTMMKPQGDVPFHTV